MVSMPNQSGVPLTGKQYAICAGDYAAAVTGLGAGLRQLTYRGRPMITGYEPDELPPAGAGQLLAPWPNRVDGGQYSFDGASYQLDLSEPARGNAIHGLTRWATWGAGRTGDTGSTGEISTGEIRTGEIRTGESSTGDNSESAASTGASAVTLSYLLLGSHGYPFCLELTARYQLDQADGLQVAITARNAGSRPAPYGTGSHPYLTAGTALVDDCELELPAARWLPADDRGIPAGAEQDIAGTPFDFRSRRRIGGTSLDDAFTGLARDGDGRARVLLSRGEHAVALWAGPGYDWLQVFTGDGLDPAHRRRALAVEPMTCPANAFVTGTGLLVLQPGDSVTHSWGLQVSPGAVAGAAEMR